LQKVGVIQGVAPPFKTVHNATRANCGPRVLLLMTVHHDYSYRLGTEFMQRCHSCLSSDLLRERFAVLRQDERWLNSWEIYEFNLWIKNKTEEDFVKLLNWLQDLHDTQAAMLRPHSFPLPARHYAARVQRNASIIPESLHEPFIRLVKLLGQIHISTEEESPSTI